MRFRANAGADDVRDVYRGSAHDTNPKFWSVCHMRDSDTMLVCSVKYRPGIAFAYWLMALSRRGGGGEWHEAHRLQTAQSPTLSCPISDSRVLVGNNDSAYLELFRVQSGQRIVCFHSIRVQ